MAGRRLITVNAFVAAAVLVAGVIVGAVPTSSRTSSDPSLDSLQSSGSSSSNNNSLTVDLGYAVYEGVQDASTGLSSWLGMRFAASTEGANRWQLPQPPVPDRSQVFLANQYPNRCPQGCDSPFGTNFDYAGTEDCLFLSVQAPINASNLPVLPANVWADGGGYGQNQGNQDLSAIIKANNFGFVGVAIQYRLAAFGFLSSEEVHEHGTPNAGMYDQSFALQWVQDNIHLFGGDPERVTISGESAGGGSVMLHTMAHGGTLGNKLFTNAIAASPFLPTQHGYSDAVPSQYYYSFAEAVGCATGQSSTNSSRSIFQCLVEVDTNTLQKASSDISASGPFGSWAFLPVTDGNMVQQRPSEQLSEGKINGERVLVGNNADEGPGFVPQNITTEQDFENYVRFTFPQFNDSIIDQVLATYPSTTDAVNPNAPLFATKGDSGPTALNQSTYGTGQQQRADNLYGEATFVCPAYWLGEAFNGNGNGKDKGGGGGEAYKYQFSVIGGQHGMDVVGYFGPTPAYFSADFEAAFMNIWGQFVITGNPSISNTLANGASASSSPSNPTTSPNPISSWPAYTPTSPYQINLNQTGGTPCQYPGAFWTDITYYCGDSLRNDFSLVDARAWEGGRGARCDFWRSVGAVVPE